MSARPTVQVGLALFLLFQGLYGVTASGRVDRMQDEIEVYLQVESLWDRGSVAIPQIMPEYFYGRIGLDGEQYAPWGPGGAFLSLPHHALARAVAAVLGVERRNGRAWDELVAGVTSLSSTTWSALAVVGLFVAALALGASIRRATLMALLLGGTTLLWPYATLFFGEPQTTALLIWAVAWQLRGERVLAAAATCVMLLVKATNVILLPALLAVACWDHLASDRSRRERLVAALEAAAPIVFAIYVAGMIHVEFNAARFGDPLQVGYNWSELGRPGEAPKPFLLADMPRGVFGLLLSPGKSLFLFAPAVLLALARLKPFARERPACAVAWAAVLICPLLFFGAFNYWEGGYCFGPRYLLPSVPLLLLPLAFGRPPGKAPLVACVALGVVVQILGASVSYHEDQDYNDLGDPNWEPNYFVKHEVDSPDVPVGRPLNRYNLGYSPFVGYPRLLFKHLASGDPGGGKTGLEFFPLRMIRVARRSPPGALPSALPWLLPLPFVFLLGAGLFGLRRLPSDAPTL
jgi:hypothetical protein